MKAYYNEWDKEAAAWLRQLIKDGLITDGEVDERSITEVDAVDLVGFDRVHWFAGIGTWDYCLNQAGWGNRPVWTASLPCFPAGTLVITKRGTIPIEEVVKGDYVLTHKARWRLVTAAWSKGIGDCVEVKGQGHYGIVCTPEHPFLTKDGDWVDASNLSGEKWSLVSSFPSMEMPEIDQSSKGYFFDKHLGKIRVKGEKNGKSVYIGVAENTDDAKKMRCEAIKSGLIEVRGANAVDTSSIGFARFLGYWLGDGWVSGESVFLCGSLQDKDLLEEIMRGAGLQATHSQERTSSRVQCGSKGLVAWLTENFGKGAHGKRIPVWLHGASQEYRESFLHGYWEADGHDEKPNKGGMVRRFTTVSKPIAIGIRVLLNQAGISASITKHKINRQTTIEGRYVSARPFFRITAYERSRSFEFGDLHGYGLVRSVEPAGEHRVYNIAVDEDESYTADGIVVHNCQPFSVAGKGLGKEDERHLLPHFMELVRQCKPDTIFGEQVAAAIKHGWLDDLYAAMEDCGYSVGSAIIGAHSIGAAHIRQRLYWVADNISARLQKQPGIRIVSSKENGNDSRQDSAGSGRMGITNINGCQQGSEASTAARYRNTVDAAGGVDWLYCRDNKYRPIKSGLKPLVDGSAEGVVYCGDQSQAINADYSTEARAMRLKGYGNAIVAGCGIEFISAFMDVMNW